MMPRRHALGWECGGSAQKLAETLLVALRLMLAVKGVLLAGTQTLAVLWTLVQSGWGPSKQFDLKVVRRKCE